VNTKTDLLNKPANLKKKVNASENESDLTPELIQIKQNNLMFQSIIANSPDLVTLQDLDGNFTYIGPRCEEIVGCTSDELKAMQNLEYINKIDRTEAIRIKEKAFSDGKIMSFEYRVQVNNREEVWIHHTFSPLFRHGKPFRIQSNLRDITIQKQYEETLMEIDKELTESNVKLHNKNVALEELLIQVEIQKTKINQQVQTNINNLVRPLLDSLIVRVSSSNKAILELIKHNLELISSSFSQKVSSKYYSLSKREIEICNMIKQGLSSKEIAIILNIATATVTTHRNKIRKKLGLLNSSTNLPAYLNSL